MIGENYAITAAHCFEGTEKRSFEATVGGTVRKIKDVRLHNCYADQATKTNRNGADIAILVFDEPVQDITPVPIWNSESDGTEVGQNFTLIGYGERGPIGEREQKERPAGVLLTGTNVVTSTAGNFITYKFDELSSALNDEAMSWAGDSGGPALIWTGSDFESGYKIGGVNNSGDCCDIGSEDNYARLGGDALDWIVANTASVDGPVIDDANPCSAFGEPVPMENQGGNEDEGSEDSASQGSSTDSSSESSIDSSSDTESSDSVDSASDDSCDSSYYDDCDVDEDSGSYDDDSCDSDYYDDCDDY